jgi:ribosomal protein S18 acetylase RimI-like enzyme
MRAGPDLTWRAVLDEEIVGVVTCFIRPDGRCFLRFRSCCEDAFAPLLDGVAADLARELHVTVDEADGEAVRRYEKLGFLVHRREHLYVVPTDPRVTGLRAVALPSGFVLVRADRVDETRLRLLDDELRREVPGTDGWRWDEAGFREETFSEAFDPATYLVAVEKASGEYTGLVRVWNNADRPRLGLIGVLAPYRRRGLARALLAQAFAVLDERGKREVAAEVDQTNTASLALIESIGAWRAGGHVELIRTGDARA